VVNKQQQQQQQQQQQRADVVSTMSQHLHIMLSMTGAER
jgi:hypothetical protein